MSTSHEKKALLSILFIFLIGIGGISFFLIKEKSNSPVGLAWENSHYGILGNCFCKTDFSKYWEDGGELNVNDPSLLFIGIKTKQSCANQCRQFCPYGVCKGKYFLLRER